MVSSFFGTPNFPQSPESPSPTNEPTRTWTSIVSSVGKDWSWWIHIDRTLEKSEPMAQGRIFCQVIQAAVTFTSSAIIGGHVSWKKGSLNHLTKVTSRIARCSFFAWMGRMMSFWTDKIHSRVFFQKKDYYSPAHIPSKGIWEDEFAFPLVGYVCYFPGGYLRKRMISTVPGIDCSIFYGAWLAWNRFSGPNQVLRGKDNFWCKK